MQCSIARNRARLQQLGLADAANKFVATTAKPKCARRTGLVHLARRPVDLQLRRI